MKEKKYNIILSKEEFALLKDIIATVVFTGQEVITDDKFKSLDDMEKFIIKQNKRIDLGINIFKQKLNQDGFNIW